MSVGESHFCAINTSGGVECWGNDVKPGKTNDFRTAVIAEEDEEVIFSWIAWPDQATRAAGAEKVMKDERMQPKEGEDMPFVGARLIYGGFEELLDAKG